MVSSGGNVARQPATQRAHRQAVERVMEIIQSRLQEKLLLEVVAREAAYSLYHLCRVFKSESGMTIHTYVNRQRLLTALEQLGRVGNLARLGGASWVYVAKSFGSGFQGGAR